MKAFFWTVRMLLTEEDGPTAVEYAVMLSLIVSCAWPLLRQLGQTPATCSPMSPTRFRFTES